MVLIFLLVIRNSYLHFRIQFQLRVFIFWSILCLSNQVKVKNISIALERQIRSIGFPEGSGMGVLNQSFTIT